MNSHSKFSWLLVAGILGGLSEVIWISFYSYLVNIPISDIGSAITATVFSSKMDFYLAPLMGLLIHMLLSILLVFGFGLLLLPMIERVINNKTTILVASVVTLVLVWKINFFLLLPILNPDFISLMPLTVTLMSKTLFGLTMGAVLSLYHSTEIRLNV